MEERDVHAAGLLLGVHGRQIGTPLIYELLTKEIQEVQQSIPTAISSPTSPNSSSSYPATQSYDDEAAAVDAVAIDVELDDDVAIIEQAASNPMNQNSTIDVDAAEGEKQDAAPFAEGSPAEAEG
jgi:hypothetical protein